MKIRSIIFSTVRKNPILVSAVILSIVFSALSSVVPPLILAEIVDTLASGSLFPFYLVVLYFLTIVLDGFFSSGEDSLLVALGEKMTKNIREEMIHKLNRLEAGEIESENAGGLTEIFLGDVNTLEALFSSGVIALVSDIFRLLVTLSVIAYKNMGLMLIMLIILPLTAIYTRHVQKRTLIAQTDERKAEERLSGEVPETIHNIRTIHNLGGESFMEKRYEESIEKSYRAVNKTGFYDSIYSPLILILNAFVASLVFLLSSSGNERVLTLFGMSAGTALAVVNYISRIFTPIENLGMEIQTIESAFAGKKRIEDFLSKKERKIPPEREEKIDGDIILNHVTFGYDERKFIKDLSLHIKKGEHVTLYGRTGAGKSTILKLITGLYSPDEGRITIGGIASSDIPDNLRRRTIGVVEQNFTLVEGTILDEITLSDPLITRDMAVKAAETAGIHEKIMSLEKGYDTRAEGNLFSEGEWELINIARATAGDPGILLLDEITASLDTKSGERILKALETASRGRTVISISHRLDIEDDTRLIPVN